MPRQHLGQFQSAPNLGESDCYRQRFVDRQDRNHPGTEADIRNLQDNRGCRSYPSKGTDGHERFVETTFLAYGLDHLRTPVVVRRQHGSRA